MLKYDLKTNVFANGVIEQELFSELHGSAKSMCRWICDAREQGLKEALMKLGWTPPNKSVVETGK